MPGGFTYVSPEEKAQQNQEEVEYFRQAQGGPRSEMEAYLRQERGLADRTYDELAGGRLSVAQQQMQAGLAGTQQALASQAAMGGANPLAARSAAYAGGMAGADIARQTAALRAQEMQAARQMQMGALQRGTEGILSQQQMDLQAAQGAAQKEAAREAQQLAEEQAGWQQTKDIVSMATGGIGSDRRMKDVYASDPSTKTISAYMPQGGGRYGAAMPMPVAPPPTMLVEVPNPAWYPGDVSAPEDIVVQSSRPAMPPTIMDYVNRGAYGPQAPVRQPGRAAGAGKAAGKAPKGKAPEKGATKALKTLGEEVVAAPPRNPQEEYYWGPEYFGDEYSQGYTRKPLFIKDYIPRPSYERGVEAKDLYQLKPEFFEQEFPSVPWRDPEESYETLGQRQAQEEWEGASRQLASAREKGLRDLARRTGAVKLAPEGIILTGETWEQMARRIEAEQRRKYHEQGGPGI